MSQSARHPANAHHTSCQLFVFRAILSFRFTHSTMNQTDIPDLSKKGFLCQPPRAFSLRSILSVHRNPGPRRLRHGDVRRWPRPGSTSVAAGVQRKRPRRPAAHRRIQSIALYAAGTTGIGSGCALHAHRACNNGRKRQLRHHRALLLQSRRPGLHRRHRRQCRRRRQLLPSP